MLRGVDGNDAINIYLLPMDFKTVSPYIGNW